MPVGALLVFVLAVAAALGWAVWRRGAARQAHPSAATVRTVAAGAGPVERTLRVTGVTGAERFQTLLAPRLPGSRRSSSVGGFQMILQSLVEPGATVKEGSVVAEFDRQYMELRYDDYRSVVMQYVASLKKLKATLEIKRAAQRQKVLRTRAEMEKAALNLKTAPVRSAMQVERFQLALEEARSRYRASLEEARLLEISEQAQIRRSELHLAEMRMNLAFAQSNVNRMVVRAGMDGVAVVQSIRRGTEYEQIDVGDQLTPGQAFLQIVDLDSMLLQAMVNQVDIDELRIGMTARVRLDGFAGVELPARVVSIGTMVQPSGWRADYVRRVPVRFKLEGKHQRLVPNVSASGDILLAREDSGVWAPAEAVFQEAGRTVCYVRAGAGWERREVETGLANPVRVAIRSGLRAGDVLAAQIP